MAPGTAEEMVIPQQLVGWVIGRSGESLRQIKQSSGATLVLNQDTKAQGFSVVRFAGDPDSVSKAKESIKRKLAEVEGKAAPPVQPVSVEGGALQLHQGALQQPQQSVGTSATNASTTSVAIQAIAALLTGAAGSGSGASTGLGTPLAAAAPTPTSTASAGADVVSTDTSVASTGGAADGLHGLVHALGQLNSAMASPGQLSPPAGQPAQPSPRPVVRPLGARPAAVRPLQPRPSAAPQVAALSTPQYLGASMAATPSRPMVATASPFQESLPADGEGIPLPGATTIVRPCLGGMGGQQAPVPTPAPLPSPTPAGQPLLDMAPSQYIDVPGLTSAPKAAGAAAPDPLQVLGLQASLPGDLTEYESLLDAGVMGEL
mmetsp:Transcript_62751/g.146075  ORF Transcript_62751/g.146075 Transcript_62751/m.146075 type:complete len:375 (+) Transcript_62751:1-1125(+)